MQADEAFVRSLNEHLTPLSWEGRLNALAEYAHLRKAFSTSFSLEDQAVTHVIAREKLNIRVFTLDTGRLFEAVHEVHQRTREAYDLSIETYHPDAAQLSAYVAQNGINGFYSSVDNRLSCCHIRKVEPLERALRDTDLWVDGIRRDHSSVRADLSVVEWDAQRQIIKCHPLLELPQEALMAFIKDNTVPYNPMVEAGYPSIGCAPCTRAVQPGEHPRAGRWWWEQESARECGLHIKDGKLVRIGTAKDEAHAG